MNRLAKIMKPDPQPAYVLLSVILTAFGIGVWRKIPNQFGHVAGATLIVVTVILLVRFTRGLLVETQLIKTGMRTQARVVRVDEQKIRERDGTESTTWSVVFTFTDAMGVVHEDSVEVEDAEEAEKYRRPGALVSIRYHPDFPEQFRLD